MPHPVSETLRRRYLPLASGRAGLVRTSLASMTSSATLSVPLESMA
jgi:hypothetical protein